MCSSNPASSSCLNLPRLAAQLLLCSATLWPCLLGAQQAAPQEAQAGPATAPPEESIFFGTVDVQVVNVDVFVTDAKNQPVTGLKTEDFQLLEDGRPVTVTHFYAVEDRPRHPSRAEVPGSAPVPSPVPSEALADLSAASAAEDQRLYLVVYYDNLHLKPFSRNRAGRELRRFLRANLQAGDRTMLVTFERNLHVRQAFTENLSLVERALQEAETLTGFAVQKEADRSQIIKRMDSSRGLSEAQAHIDLYARETHRDVESSIDGLKGVIASLSGIPGRKALFYVSDGLPMEPAHDLYLMLDYKYRDSAQGLLQSSRYNVRGDFREVVAQANSNRVTFYTLQASGLRSHGSLSAESGGLKDGGSALDADLALESDLQEPLQVLAEGTGGQAVIGTNNLAGGLERWAEDLRTFYSLGFSPSHSGDGRYHRLEVQVKGRRGLTVRHRDGYRDKTPTDQLRDGTLASLLHGAGVNPMGLSVQLGQGKQRDDGFLLVPIEVRIPLGRVTLVPQDAAYLGRLQISLAVAEDERGTSAPHIEPLTLSLPAGDLPMALEKYYVYAVELLMRPGQQLLAVGVRDELAGETSYLRQGVKVSL